MDPSWDDKVWLLVQAIPKGKVASYGQLAAMLGFPRRSRHVGHALRRTPDELDVPWFRVINGQGRISFSPQSSQYFIQRALLEKEGVRFKQNGAIDLRIYRWSP